MSDLKICISSRSPNIVPDSLGSKLPLWKCFRTRYRKY